MVGDILDFINGERGARLWWEMSLVVVGDVLNNVNGKLGARLWWEIYSTV